jgi:3-oxoacyl-[acyl-carrier protein] reductase
MGRLEGKRAIVTGGARGIGAAIAQAFVKEGAQVVVVDLAQESDSREVLAGMPPADGGQATYLQTDVSDQVQVEAMVGRVLAQFGQIDILVNNAGIVSQVFLADMPVEEWDRVMAVNLRGVFLCTRFVLPHMLAQGHGKIISIASNLGQIGGAEMVHYSASKGGVIAFTKALAREVSNKGIQVNAIAPGPILTDMMKAESSEWQDQKLSELALGRFGQPSEVAPTAVFLASDDSSYYVGQTLSPNGGDTML